MKPTVFEIESVLREIVRRFEDGEGGETPRCADILWTHEPLSRGIQETIKAILGEDKSGKLHYDYLERQARGWLIHLVRQEKCVSEAKVTRLAQRPLRFATKQAVLEDRNTLIEDSATKPARSYRARGRRRQKAAANNPEEMNQWGCEENEDMRTLKVASMVSKARPWYMEDVVRDNYGRLIRYQAG